jgi:hypothetical protein
MSATEDLATLQANNTADATALASLEGELNSPAVPSIGDNLLDAVVQSLTSQGYTVTAPETETPAEDATETTEES